MPMASANQSPPVQSVGHIPATGQATIAPNGLAAISHGSRVPLDGPDSAQGSRLAPAHDQPRPSDRVVAPGNVHPPNQLNGQDRAHIHGQSPTEGLVQAPARAFGQVPAGAFGSDTIANGVFGQDPTQDLQQQPLAVVPRQAPAIVDVQLLAGFTPQVPVRR
ncbi:hypothetical protein FKW77_000500 [Venturia effusa]|uniref:Uncharacterized protein n=1 Tax=Venturia effusa TaxID=50376 RepID=A0A517LJS7_9PEZI|nr:hypothetical protein FKW77_000500 [Venturia effusa]